MSSGKQGFLRNVRVTPRMFRVGLNLWPPFRGAGIRVTRVSENYREIDVELRFRLLKRNYFGTQFGGSMFAMTDPFFALMMLRNLGAGYVVWDKSGGIDYRRPGRGDVFARFVLPAAAIARAKRATAGGDKHEPVFRVRIEDRDGQTVAEATKTLYIRRRAEGATP